MGKGLGRFALAAALAVLASRASALETLCADTLDDDADALVDCADADCAFDPGCIQEVYRELKVEHDDQGRPYLNLYYVSLPEVPALDDLANTAASTTNKCVGLPGPPAGPSRGDGILNADDLLCWFWGREGWMAVGHRNADQCVDESRHAEDTPLGIHFTGSWTAPLGPPEGYTVRVGDSRDPTAEHLNPVVLRGWCDPSWPGQVLGDSACLPEVHYLHVPYDVLYGTADEILCGLGPPGGDWEDVVINSTGGPGSDGMPDTCTNGAFVAAQPGSLMAVLTVDNVKDGSLPPSGGLIPTDNVIYGRTVTLNNFGKLLFSGENFVLDTGHSYRLDVAPSHPVTLWHPPQEGVNCVATPPDALLFMRHEPDGSITASWEELGTPSDHGLHAQDLSTLPSSLRDVLACGLPAGPASIPLVDPLGAGRNRAYLLTTRRGATEWMGTDSFGVERPATLPVGCP